MVRILQDNAEVDCRYASSTTRTRLHQRSSPKTYSSPMALRQFASSAASSLGLRAAVLPALATSSVFASSGLRAAFDRTFATGGPTIDMPKPNDECQQDAEYACHVCALCCERILASATAPPHAICPLHPISKPSQDTIPLPTSTSDLY
eukprot:scaffold15700_cov35-Prasinocladus_malaysianus.AAC.3